MSKLVGVLVAVALGATACGAGGSAAPETRGPAEQLLTQADVDRYSAGSPARTLLSWWRNAQFANLTAFLNGFEPELRERLVESGRAGDALIYFSGTIVNARPTILSVLRDGGNATVYTRIVYRQPVGTKRFIVYSVPRAFAMTRQRGGWLLRDDGYLQAALTKELRRPAD